MPTYSVPKPISLKTLLDTEWPEEIFIEGGILSRGDCLLIAADSKAGKSTLIAGLIRQIMIGGDFLGFNVVKPLRVLYMQAELREARLKERLIKTYASMNGINQNSFVWNTRGLIMVEENYELICEVIKETTPDILIIDPMINFHNYDENNSSQMTQFFRRLDRLQHDFNLSIIMAQHFKKTQDFKNKLPLLEMVRGTSALRGWADTTIAMEGRTADEVRRLEFDIRNSDKIVRRTIKYDPKKREFDWSDPVRSVVKIVEKRLSGGSKMSTTDFIDFLVSDCGEFIGRKRSAAYEFKNILISSQLILEEVSGKSKLVSLLQTA